MNSVCVFSSICEEDACWIEQYLCEIERMEVPFVIHLDRCSSVTKERLVTHRKCVGNTQRSGPLFDETHKQQVFDLCQSLGYKWALAWDVDETWSKNGPEMLSRASDLDCDFIVARWVNLWNDINHVRVDGPFSGGRREKLYNLKSGRWRWFDKTTNGPKLIDSRGNPVNDRARRVDFHELVCVHHGMMTRELREQHKARWDKIYTAAAGRNPYGFWNYALDEGSYPPRIAEWTE